MGFFSVLKGIVSVVTIGKDVIDGATGLVSSLLKKETEPVAADAPVTETVETVQEVVDIIKSDSVGSVLTSLLLALPEAFQNDINDASKNTVETCQKVRSYVNIFLQVVDIIETNAKAADESIPDRSM